MPENVKPQYIPSSSIRWSDTFTSFQSGNEHHVAAKCSGKRWLSGLQCATTHTWGLLRRAAGIQRRRAPPVLLEGHEPDALDNTFSSPLHNLLNLFLQ